METFEPSTVYSGIHFCKCITAVIAVAVHMHLLYPCTCNSTFSWNCVPTYILPEQTFSGNKNKLSYQKSVYLQNDFETDISILYIDI